MYHSCNVSVSRHQTYWLHILGKGPNIWDTLTHEHPDYVVDAATGDVADDSYHLYKEDVKILKELGVSNCPRLFKLEDAESLKTL
jgi:beta-glucosidase/6-phospho-beta-glucosidase/beta-galactosidase